MSDTLLTATRFTSLGLAEPLQQALDELGLEFCTPIQARALPALLEGRDVAGQGQTGTGKTATFLLGALQRMLTREPNENRRPQDPRAVVIAPTRELAIQIHADASKLAKHTDIRLGLAYGGVDYQKQRDQFADGVDLLVGTPGRVIDYFKQRTFSLKHVEVAILDEADRMFDLGFLSDIRFLLRRMPEPTERLNLLFSATLSYRVLELAYEHMNNPEQIVAETDNGHERQIREEVYYPANNEKVRLLIGLLRRHQPQRSIVFANTKRAVERIRAYLLGNGFECAVLSGDVHQRKRQSLLKRFADGEINILVATDVAARGLHIPEVSHVFNYDLPNDPEDYVHRIGRTARMDAEGDAISFACEDYAMALPDIETYREKRLNPMNLEPELLPELDPPKRPKKKPGDQAHPKGKHRGDGNKSGPRRRRGGRGGKPKQQSSDSSS